MVTVKNGNLSVEQVGCGGAMTEERRKKILEFEDKHKELDDDSFYRLAEMRGIKPEEFIRAEEWAVTIE